MLAPALQQGQLWGGTFSLTPDYLVADLSKPVLMSHPCSSSGNGSLADTGLVLGIPFPGIGMESMPFPLPRDPGV